MKNFLLISLLVLSIGLKAQWTEIDMFPGSKRFAAVDFVVNGNAYILGGIVENGPSYTGYNELWKFDHQNETWTKEANYPPGDVYGAISFVINNVAYVGLGSNKNGFESNQFYAFDGTTGKWTKKANFPGDTRLFAFSFSSNGKGYIGAGYTYTSPSNYLTDFWEYDPANDKWTKKSDYPGDGQVGLTAMTIGDVGYVGMGDDGGFYKIDFWIYDSGNDSWSSASNFPGNNYSFYSTATANGKGYMIGGEEDHGLYSKQMWSYDPVDNKWEVAFTFSGKARGYGNMFFVNNALYFGLGLTGPSDSDASTDLWKYQLGPTGINNNSVIGDLNIYPNPATNELFIVLESNTIVNSLKIYNSRGQHVNCSINYGDGTAMLNLDELPTGLYLVEINNSTLKKFLKK